MDQNILLLFSVNILVALCDPNLRGDTGENFLDAGQGCGETGQLFDAPIPGVYKYHSKRSRRSVVSNPSKLWPNGLIPYVIDNGISASGKRLIRRAMDLWEKKTCIKFVKRVNEIDYVNLFRGQGCCSNVGRRGGQQTLSLGIGCLRHGIVVHELGHAIGFWHEQNRPDRGSFIDILYNNVETGKAINFNLLAEGRVKTLDQDYDYQSIMHYGTDFFNKGGGDTIRPKEIYRIDPNVIGSRYYSYAGDILSELDILKANIMYKCTKIHECGGTLFRSNGLVTSPLYSTEQKRESKDCVWVLNRNPTQLMHSHFTSTLTLIFEVFDVGHKNPVTGQCDNDYIEIREGKGFLSPFLVRLCGYGIPEPITTFSESIYVKLHTAVDTEGLIEKLPNFRIKFKTDECSKTLVGLDDTIESPGFPSQYPTGSDCLWKVKVRKGYKIVLRFISFSLRSSESEHECKDYLDLIQGGRDNVFIGRYCGYHSPGEVTFDSNEIMIRLHTSNHSYQDSFAAGFSASYYAEDVDECATGQHHCDLDCLNYKGSYSCSCLPGYKDVQINDWSHKSCLDIDECAANNGGCSHECVNTDGSFFCSCPGGLVLAANNTCIDINECKPPYDFCSHQCHNTIGSYDCSCPPNFILLADKKTCKELPRCGGNLTATVGAIESPIIPITYKKEVNCRWHIKVNRHLRLILSFRLPWSTISSCQNYLYIKSEREGNDEPRHVKVCSKSDLADELDLKSSSVFLEYHAEKPYPAPFHVRYRTVRRLANSCGGAFTTKKDIIKTPGYPFRYPSSANCIWTIKGRPALRTRIKFLDFSVEFSRNCLYDYVEIEEHSSMQSITKRIGRFCGYRIPPDIVVSSHNDIIVKFVSDATVRKRGIRIQFLKF